MVSKAICCKEALAKNWGQVSVSCRLRMLSSVRIWCPLLTLYGYGLTLQSQKNISAMHVSLSDEQDAAVAFVILEAL